MTKFATASHALTAPIEVRPRPTREGWTPGRTTWSVLGWVGVSAIVIGTAFAIVKASGMRPGYDAFGWLVWGHQVLHGSLNTDGAPSWKPVAFLFTLPYDLFGDSGQLWLWMVTSVAAALASGVFAARIAFRLTWPSPGRRYAPFVAAAFAGAGVLALDGYSHLTLIASADPLVVALCLAAIDFHLGKRFRLALAMLVLASLGRPEAWPILGLYALWAGWARPGMRLAAVVGLALIPAFWFSVPALTSKSWFISGDLALRTVNAANVITGSKILGVLGRFGDLSVLPVQIAAIVGLVIGALRRDLVILGLTVAAALWVATEIGLALHGWSGAERYLLEPGAVMVIVAASAVGRVLTFSPAGSTVSPTNLTVPLDSSVATDADDEQPGAQEHTPHAVALAARWLTIAGDGEIAGLGSNGHTSTTALAGEPAGMAATTAQTATNSANGVGVNGIGASGDRPTTTAGGDSNGSRAGGSNGGGRHPQPASARWPSRGRRALGWATALASIALVAAFAVTLVPTARQRARTARADVDDARAAGTQIVRLQAVVDRDGGPARIRACGQPVTLVGLQSKVAWATGLNVGNVGFRPGKAIDSGKPIMFFQPHLDGWRVLPIHMVKANAAACNRLKLDDFS